MAAPTRFIAIVKMGVANLNPATYLQIVRVGNDHTGDAGDENVHHGRPRRPRTAQAAGAFEGPTERIVVRAKIQIRVLQSQPAGSPDFALVTDEFPPISLESDRILPRIDDAGERIASRGIKIRAPPANVA
jgi:hypothetical protein